jgi:hypothetical protein
MKPLSDNAVEDALMRDAVTPLASFGTADPGKHVQTLIPTPEWKALRDTAELRGATVSLMVRVAIRQHLEWLKVQQSPRGATELISELLR